MEAPLNALSGVNKEIVDDELCLRANGCGCVAHGIFCRSVEFRPGEGEQSNGEMKAIRTGWFSAVVPLSIGANW